MVAHADEGPILLVKKLGGLLLIIVGCVLAAIGVEYASTGTVILGALFLAVGIALLVMKIMRRNQGAHLG